MFTFFPSQEEMLAAARDPETTGLKNYLKAKLSGKVADEVAQQRLEICKKCTTLSVKMERLFREIDGKLYCGVPRHEHILRSEKKEGCGCNLADKVKYRSSACPVSHWLSEIEEKVEEVKTCCQKRLFPEATESNSIKLHLANNDALLVPVELILALNDLSKLDFVNAATEIKMFGGASILVLESVEVIKELKEKLRLKRIVNWTPEILKQEAAKHDLEVITHDWPRIVFCKKGIPDVKMAVVMDAEKPEKTLERAKLQFSKMGIQTEEDIKRDGYERAKQEHKRAKKGGCGCGSKSRSS